MYRYLPTGEKILYGVSYYSIEQNKSNRELFVMNSDGSEKLQLTETPENEFNAVWHPDGQQDRLPLLRFR